MSVATLTTLLLERDKDEPGVSDRVSNTEVCECGYLTRIRKTNVRVRDCFNPSRFPKMPNDVDGLSFVDFTQIKFHTRLQSNEFQTQRSGTLNYNATEMQSQKRAASKSSKSVANPYSLQKKITMCCSSNVDAKIEFIPKDFVEPQILSINNDITFDDESKKIYTSALKYINKFHQFMNTKLSEQNCQYGDADYNNENAFKFPEVPNYSIVFMKLLNQLQPINVDSTIRNVKKGPPIVEKPTIQIIDNQKHTKTILKHNLTTTNNSVSPPIRDYFKDRNELIKEDQITKSVCINYGLNEDICVDNSMDHCENLRPKMIQGHKYVQKPDVPDHFSKECGDINDSSTPEAEKNNSPSKDLMMNLVKERVLEEFFCSYKNTNASVNIKKDEKEAKLVQSCFNIVNIQPQINMLDYARQKQERKKKNTIELPTVRNLEVAVQNQEVGSLPKKTQHGPTTPKKVKNMFEKISRTKHSDKIVGTTRVLSKILSDSDSEIMDDEEFERTRNGTNIFKKKRDEKEHKKNADSEKSHPLKLTEKDLSKLNQKMLNAIGIFTDRGDIRPGIINILEEQKRAMSNDERNKQFRSKRKWDIQIHLKPKNEHTGSLTSLSSIAALSVQSLNIGDDIDKIQQTE